MKTSAGSEKSNEVVPLFGTWRNAYAIVVIAFSLEVALFYLLDRFFA